MKKMKKCTGLFLLLAVFVTAMSLPTTVSAKTTYGITKASTVMYKSASTASSKVITVPAGKSLTIHSFIANSSGSWLRVTYNVSVGPYTWTSYSGYVKSSSIKSTYNF